MGFKLNNELFKNRFLPKWVVLYNFVTINESGKLTQSLRVERRKKIKRILT